MPLGNSPQLAAVVSTFAAFLCGAVGLVADVGTGPSVLLALILPPSWYVLAIKAICGWENKLLGANIVEGDPQGGVNLLPLIIVTLVSLLLLSSCVRTKEDPGQYIPMAVPCCYMGTFPV